MADENTPTGHPGHTVRSYDEDLGRLGTMLAEMGGTVENQVGLAAEAMMEHDTPAATRAVELDPEVDELERRVETFVIRLLALRQPVADDLRKIVAALKITGDLERIGDYAANAAKRSISLAKRCAHAPPPLLSGGGCGFDGHSLLHGSSWPFRN